eukprot:SAG31_NODE_13968_length_834_cov_0.968707_2_plen_89_part_01
MVRCPFIQNRDTNSPVISNGSGVPAFAIRGNRRTRAEALLVSAHTSPWATVWATGGTAVLGAAGTGGKRSYFLVFVQLFEKCGTLIERN